MLGTQRQDRILEEIHRHGAVRVSDLVDLLGVSDMTIRRDLDVLAKRGLLDKVRPRSAPPGGRGRPHQVGRDRPDAFATAEEADVLVTDSGLPRRVQKLMSQRVDELVLAQVPAREASTGM